MRPEQELERVLLAFEREVTDASDDEILAAARELGMNPHMKCSSAFFGVTVLVRLGQPPDKPARRRKRLYVARRRIPKDDVPPSS